MAITSPIATPFGCAVPAPSFRVVFDRYLPYVWRVLRAMRVPPSDIEDVCQEVFLVVARKLPQFEPRARLSTWIYSICYRVVREQRRRNARKRESACDPPADCGEPAQQGRALEERQVFERLEQVLDGLDEDKRIVFVLFDIEQVSMKEIADVLGVPLQTGYTRLHAARAFVKDRWLLLDKETSHV